MTTRTRSKSRSAPAGTLSVTAGLPGWVVPLGAVLLVIVLITAEAVDPNGPLSVVDEFLEYYSGVFSLVALSITVMIGLVATDRLVLTIRHRILLQAAHRATALTAMVFLGVHIAMKVAEGHARPWDVVVPFLTDHRPVHVGLGTVATYLMVLATWTGVVRRRFANHANPGLWRALHASAYLCWIVALVHGLNSGRSADAWVTVSYAICVFLVCLLLLVRICASGSERSPVARARTLATTPASGRRAAAPVLRAAEIPLATVADVPRHPEQPVARHPDLPPVARYQDLPPVARHQDLPPVRDWDVTDDEFLSYLRGGATR